MDETEKHLLWMLRTAADPEEAHYYAAQLLAYREIKPPVDTHPSDMVQSRSTTERNQHDRA